MNKKINPIMAILLIIVGVYVLYNLLTLHHEEKKVQIRVYPVEIGE